MGYVKFAIIKLLLGCKFDTMRITFIAFCLCCVFAGCKSDGNYYLHPTNEKEYKVELLCELDWAARSYVSKLFYVDSALMVLGWDLATGTYIHTYMLPGIDRNDYLHKGRGEGEIMGVFQIPFIQDDVLVLSNQEKSLCINIHSLIHKAELELVPQLPPQSRWVRYCREIKGRIFELLYTSPRPNMEQHPRFRVRDELNNILFEDWNWPIDDPALRWDVQQMLSFSPDCSKFVCSVVTGCGIIETFTFPKLDNIASNIYFIADFYYNQNTSSNRITRRYNNKRDGFIDICTTDSEIWAIWDGATDWSVPDEERPYPTKNTIAVFDWDLNLKRTIKLDYNVLNLAYDEITNVLYLVALNKAGDKYLGSVNLN